MSDDLDNTCYGVFGGSHLVESIYGGHTGGRLGHAIDSELFNEEELTHPHLNKDPTPLEAANYIALCIEKVKSYDQI